MASKLVQKRVGSRTQDKSKDSESSINVSGRRAIGEATTDASELQRLLELERAKCHKLEDEIHSKDERFKRKEEKYLMLLEEFKQELRGKIEVEQSPIDEQYAKQITGLHALHGQVMGLVGNIQGSTSRVLATQERDIIRRFNIKLNDLKANLEKEKKQKIESVETNAEHELKRAHELEMLRASIELVENQNKELQAQNRELRQATRAQEDTNVQLVSKLVAAKSRITSLQAETERYRTASALQTQSVEVLPRLISTDKPPVEVGLGDNTSRFESSIHHLKRMLETERRNCKQAKAAYVQEMKSKTELESVLRKCIDDIREDVAGGQTSSPTANTELGKVERERLVEMLLNQEKVLSMIHDMAFPRPSRST